MKAFVFLAMAIVVCQVNTSAQTDTVREARPRVAAAPNPQIVSKLEEIVAIRQRQFTAYDNSARLGRAPVDPAAEINLVEARIGLAREKDDIEGVRNELNKLVGLQKRRLERLERLPADRVSADEVDKARIDLLDAEIRLLRH